MAVRYRQRRLLLPRRWSYPWFAQSEATMLADHFVNIGLTPRCPLSLNQLLLFWLESDTHGLMEGFISILEYPQPAAMPETAHHRVGDRSRRR